jgi:hypothetical protein
MSTTAGALTFALRSERQNGNLSAETETHLRHELRRRGWQSDDALLAEPLSQEIARLEREAATLRKLRATMFGIA